MKTTSKIDNDGAISLDQIEAPLILSSSNNINKLITPDEAPIRFLSRGITNMAGPTASGRTSLCLDASFNAIKQGLKVLYIDTERGVDLWRIKQIIKTRKLNLDLLPKGNGYKIGNTFRLELVPTMDGLLRILSKIQSAKPDLVVVDDATSHYIVLQCTNERDFRYGKPAADMIRFTGQLKIFTNTWNMAVMMISRPVSEVSKTLRKETEYPLDYLKDIGSSSMGFDPKVKLFIHKLENDLREMVIEKHRNKPRGTSCTFKITDTGVGDP